ncbi:MAG: arylesterase [Desulfuromonadales bacterium]|nr:arylesterase [Desulfuromonadales bacterium]
MPSRLKTSKSSFVTAFVCSLLLLLIACREPPRLSPLSAEGTILAFGDSLTYGTGASPQEAYPAILAALLGRPVINAGVPGETSGEGLARLAGLLEEHHPELVILCHGGNDFLQRLDPEQLRVNLQAMIALAKGAGAQVLLVGVPRPGLRLVSAPVYETVADALRLPYEAKIVSDILGDGTLKSDYIHPNAAGYRRLAQTLARQIAL